MEFFTGSITGEIKNGSNDIAVMIIYIEVIQPHGMFFISNDEIVIIAVRRGEIISP